MNANGKFYLGRVLDPVSGKTLPDPLLYDPLDLTTHAVVVGMTGSGKTGLCIDLLEEAALSGLPALMIDPKGDITNSLLHFPDLLPQDFQPWINPDQARREGKTLEQVAVEIAQLWRDNLDEWGISSERLLALKNSTHFTIFTPGSDSGIPVSILASLKAPLLSWEENRELLREKIAETVTALLGLVGYTDIDPVRSREHILLANIFENAWRKGKDLDLGELILQTQTPPFQQLGVFDVNTFFPEKERFGLAMQLNNILAAPAFQSWIEGQPLDIPDLLYEVDGRPRHSVFYIAHLPDPERMFFVTLLFSAIEAWMRSLPGTTTLRALVYFDEIFGYLPPISNPPSKPPMLRMLKQARAFGIGLILATQNPVDVDYKALSNAGTWFIGKLQTEQDKARLLDGLEGAKAGELNRGEYDRLISGLGKRIFLLHNVHQPQPVLFQTRWAMNYLAGPLTRIQLGMLNRLAGNLPAPEIMPQPPIAVVQPITPSPLEIPPSLDAFQAIPISSLEAERPPSVSDLQPTSGSATRPTTPVGITEYILPNNLTFTQAFKSAGKPYPQEAFSQGIIYHPVILAQASIRFLNRKYNLDYEILQAVLVQEPDRRGMIRWEDHVRPAFDLRQLDPATVPNAKFTTLEAPFSDEKLMKSIEKDFLDWIYRKTRTTVHAHEALKLYAGPQIFMAEFRKQCSAAARQERDAAVKKIRDAFDKKLDVLRFRLSREQRELSVDETELSQRKMEELGTHAENVLSLFSHRRTRRLSTSLAKRRLTVQAKADVNESEASITELERQIAELEENMKIELEQANEYWGSIVNQITEIEIAPYKKDVLLDAFGVAWMPFHLVVINGERVELPGFEPGL